MGIGKNGVDWEGMALHDHSRYLKIRKVLSEELDDNLVTMGDEEIESNFREHLTDVHSEVASPVLTERLELALSTLKPREEKVLRMKYGMTDGKEYTLKEIGEVFGLSPERIRQIQSKARQGMRFPVRKELLGEYVSGDTWGR